MISATSRHNHDMTEIMLKVTLNCTHTYLTISALIVSIMGVFMVVFAMLASMA